MLARTLATALSATSLLLAGAAVPAQAEGTGATTAVAVTFPDRTRVVDPVGTPYVVSVAAPEGSTVSSTWDNGTTVDHGGLGTFAVPFDRDAAGTVQVVVCPPQADCQVATSPRLTVTRTLVLDGTSLLGPESTSLLTYARGVWAGDTVDVRWTMRDAAGAVVGEEQHDDVAVTENGRVQLPVTPGRDLAEVVHTWDAEVVLADPAGGRLAATERWDVRWDATNSVDLEVHGPVVYPVEDGYKDAQQLTSTVPWDVRRVRFEAVAADGTVAWTRTMEARLGGGEVSTMFPGRTPGGTPVPAGDYELRAVSVDEAGNTAVATGAVEVRDEELTWVTWTRTLTAKQAAGRRTVGSCSTLASPAPGRGTGSLGYWSQTRCTRAKDSVVSSVGGAYVPRSPVGRYDTVDVWLTGGATSRKDSGYLRTYVHAEGRAEDVDSVLDGRWRRRSIASGDKDLVHGLSGDRPYLSWSYGLTAGSRFDVGSLELRVRYQDLR